MSAPRAPSLHQAQSNSSSIIQPNDLHGGQGQDENEPPVNNTGPPANDSSNNYNGATEDVPLYKSTRLKGYLILVFASAINFNSARKSGSIDHQARRYAEAVAIISFIANIIVMFIHFDKCSCFRQLWVKSFRSNSKVELTYLIMMIFWWVTATWINTSVKGIAGIGKAQYNLYFSTWVCTCTSIWTAERWRTAAGQPSLITSVSNMPARSPLWVGLFVLSPSLLLSILDLFFYWKTKEGGIHAIGHVSEVEWNFIIFVSALTFPISGFWVIIELFRTHEEKSNREALAEGCTLLLLVLFWIPTVCIATIPGGAASFVGNAYFLTWAAVVTTIQTFMWWLHDWKEMVHRICERQLVEYNRAKREIALRAAHQESTPGGGNR